MGLFGNFFKKNSYLTSDLGLSNELGELVQYWNREKIRLNSGIAHNAIKKFQVEFGFSFEDSFFVEYLLKVNGFVDFEWDKELFSFWSIDRIREENLDGYHSEEAIWFCDYSINLCSFGFGKTDNKIYTEYQTLGGFQPVASSFKEFIDLYLKDPYLLLR